MRLPELTARPQRAERPSQATVRPTDLGLGAVAQDIGEWSQEVERTKAIEEELGQVEAEAAVRPILERLTGDFEAEFNENGANWDASQPGFARSITTKLNERLAGFGDDLPLTPAERAAIQRGTTQYRIAVGQRANAYEAQRRGAVVAEAVQARETVETAGMMAGYMARFAELTAPIDAAFDGSQADYVPSKLAAHDQAVAEMLESTPEALRPRLQSQLTGQRLQVLGTATEVQQRGSQAFNITQARAAGDQLINAILTNPATYETARPLIDDIVASLPAAARGEEKSRLLDQAGDGFISGLIATGQHDQAIELLNGGTLDGDLRPSTKARLLSEGTRARDEMSFDDYYQQGRAQDLMEDNLASIASTGVEIEGADPGSLGLSPAARAEYTLAIEKAREQRAATPPMARMTEAQISAHVEGLKPVEGSEGFADAQRAYDLARGNAQQELKAREDDAAAWAYSNAPGLRAQREGIGSADPNVARRSARDLANGLLSMQDQAGIPMGQRRILTKAEATSMVEGAEAQADPAVGLAGLAAVVNAFQPVMGASEGDQTVAAARRQRVIADLVEAGAEPSDLAAAVTLAGRNGAMGAYVAGDRSGILNSMEQRQRDRLQGQVDANLRPYFASLDGAQRTDGLNGARRAMAYKLAAGRMQVRPGSSVEDAARWAADQIAGPYTFVGPANLRVPDSVANRRSRDLEASGGGARNGAGDIERGTAALLRNLSRNDGAGLLDPDNNPGLSAPQRRRLYADQIRTTGRWVTRGDDSGAAFVYRDNQGRWEVARDAQNRPINASWEALANGRLDTEASRSAPARPRQAAQAAPPIQAWSRAIRATETGNNPAQISRDPDGAGPAGGGAVGAMQLLPGTARAMARRLGVQYDERRLLNDVAYNTRLGNEYLSMLQQRYGGNLLLATTAYFAGEGSVDGWIRRHGDPRTGAVSPSAWLARVGRLNPRSARYPRAVFARMGLSID